MKVVVPVPVVPRVMGAIDARARRDRPSRLGIIDDGFGVVLLPAVVDRLKDRLGLCDVIYHRKPNISAVTDEAVLADLDRSCRAVVVGIGA